MAELVLSIETLVSLQRLLRSWEGWVYSKTTFFGMVIAAFARFSSVLRLGSLTSLLLYGSMSGASDFRYYGTHHVANGADAS